MKLVTAYIQPEKLNSVKQSLYENKIYKMSVTNVLGCGQQKGYNQRFRGVVTEVNLLKKICLKIAVNDEFVQPCIDAIVRVKSAMERFSSRRLNSVFASARVKLDRKRLVNSESGIQN